MRAILVFLLSVPFALATAGDYAGAWRGALDYQRPDGVVNPVYFGFNLEVGEQGAWSGAVRAYQIGLAGSLRDIATADNGLAFTFTLLDQPAYFEGRLHGQQILGTVRSIQGVREARLERVMRNIDQGLVRSRGGLYRFEDGASLLLSPSNWTFDVYELESGFFRAFFPRTEDTFFAGPGYLQPTPVTHELTFLPGGGLAFTGNRETRLAQRDGRVVVEAAQITSGDITLSALVVRPKDARAPVPGVVVAAGSGRQSKFGYSGLPFYRANWLALRGYASVIFDKRGVGDSGGSYEERTSELLAQDVASAADYLASRSDVDASRVGLIVHSQSGIYAPKTIARSKHVGYAVVISTTVVNGEIQEIIRTEQQMRADGYPPVEINDAVATQILKFYYANHRIGWDAYVAAYRRVKDRPWFESMVGSTIDIDRHSWDFWREGNGFEPFEAWQQVQIPVFMLFGDRDTVSPIEKNLEALKIAFAGERISLLTVKLYPGLDHSLFVATEGGLFEESRITRISGFMADVDRWLRDRGFGPDSK